MYLMQMVMVMVMMMVMVMVMVMDTPVPKLGKAKCLRDRQMAKTNISEFCKVPCRMVGQHLKVKNCSNKPSGLTFANKFIAYLKMRREGRWDSLKLDISDTNL